MPYYVMTLSREYWCITLFNFIFPFLFVVVLSILGPRHWLPTIAFLVMIVVSYCLPPQFERTLRQQLWIISPVVVSLLAEAKSEASDTMIRIVSSVIAFVSILQLVPCNTPSSSYCIQKVGNLQKVGKSWAFLWREFSNYFRKSPDIGYSSEAWIKDRALLWLS